MKCFVGGLVIFCALILRIEVNALGNTYVRQFSPLYANSAYSCRCLPSMDSRSARTVEEMFVYHRSICEYKTYIRSLRNNIDFLREIFLNKQTSLAKWFTQQNKGAFRNVASALDDVIHQYPTDLSIRENKRLRKLAKTYRKLGSNERNAADLSTCVALENEVKNLLRVRRATSQQKRLFGLLDLARWLLQQATAVLSLNDTIKTSLNRFIDTLPFDFLIAQARSQALKNALGAIKNNHDYSLLFDYWQALLLVDDGISMGNNKQFMSIFGDDLADAKFNQMLQSAAQATTHAEKLIAASYVFLKDFADVLVVVHRCIFANLSVVLQDSPTKAQVSATELIGLYQEVSTLPIVDTVKMIVDITTKLSGLIQALYQTDGQNDFWQWLKSNWMVIPVAASAIIIQVLRYFNTQQKTVDGGSF